MSAAEEHRPERRPPIRMGELALALAERRSASTAYVNTKVSAQGALQPEVNVTPDTTREDIERMVDLNLFAVTSIMAHNIAPSGPRFPTKPTRNAKPPEPAPTEGEILPAP